MTADARRFPTCDTGRVSPELIQRAQLELEGPPLRGLQDLREEDAPDPWLDDLLYPEGITLIAGESNAGKGWLSLRIAVALLLGERFLTAETPEPRSVLYLNPERDKLGIRFRAADEHHPALLQATHFLYDTPGQTFGQGLQTLADYVGGRLAIARKQARPFDPRNAVLILDPLRSLLAGNENDSAISAAFFAQLRQVNAPTGPLPGAAILIIHHMGWQDTQLAVARERGSSDLRGAVDVTFTLQSARQVAAHEARKAAQQRGELYAPTEDTAPNRDLLLLSPQKHRLAPRRHAPYVLELVPTPIRDTRGRLRDAVWMQPAPDVQPDEVAAVASQAKRAAKVATTEADAQRVLAALTEHGPTPVRRLWALTGLSRTRTDLAVDLLLATRRAHREVANGPIRPGPGDDEA